MNFNQIKVIMMKSINIGGILIKGDNTEGMFVSVNL